MTRKAAEKPKRCSRLAGRHLAGRHPDHKLFGDLVTRYMREKKTTR